MKAPQMGLLFVLFAIRPLAALSAFAGSASAGSALSTAVVVQAIVQWVGAGSAIDHRESGDLEGDSEGAGGERITEDEEAAEDLGRIGDGQPSRDWISTARPCLGDAAGAEIGGGT